MTPGPPADGARASERSEAVPRAPGGGEPSGPSSCFSCAATGGRERGTPTPGPRGPPPKPRAGPTATFYLPSSRRHSRPRPRARAPRVRRGDKLHPKHNETAARQGVLGPRWTQTRQTYPRPTLKREARTNETQKILGSSQLKHHNSKSPKSSMEPKLLESETSFR